MKSINKVLANTLVAWYADIHNGWVDVKKALS